MWPIGSVLGLCFCVQAGAGAHVVCELAPNDDDKNGTGDIVCGTHSSVGRKKIHESTEMSATVIRKLAVQNLAPALLRQLRALADGAYQVGNVCILGLAVLAWPVLAGRLAGLRPCRLPGCLAARRSRGSNWPPWPLLCFASALPCSPNFPGPAMHCLLGPSPRSPAEPSPPRSRGEAARVPEEHQGREARQAAPPRDLRQVLARCRPRARTRRSSATAGAERVRGREDR